MNIISLGAGVQSTTMALMAARGDLTPMPDHAIFADTGDEPKAVYRHLERLSLPFPVHIVSNGKLSKRLFEGDDEARIPFFVGHGGIATRQCTRNYKIRPIRRKIRELLGVGPRSHIAPGTVESWVGISTDEIIRLKPSGVQFIKNRHPLIEKRMSRQDCVSWLRKHQHPVPPKSSCVYCPYKRDDQWRALRDNDPEGWAAACEVDRKLREPENVARFRGELFVHRSRVPLAEAKFIENDMPLFGGEFAEECEGMCGV